MSHLLTQEQKVVCVRLCKELLQMYGDKWPFEIGSGYETWVLHFGPNDKESNQAISFSGHSHDSQEFQIYYTKYMDIRHQDK